MSVYVDTSALYAALVRTDGNHPVASAVLPALLKRGDPMIATSYVLIETLSLLQSRIGLGAAMMFDQDLLPHLEIRWVDRDLHAQAFKRLGLRGARRVSLVDCASFVVMEQLGIRHVFAFDPHFEQEGFTLVRQPGDLS